MFFMIGYVCKIPKGFGMELALTQIAVECCVMFLLVLMRLTTSLPQMQTMIGIVYDLSED